MNAKKPQTRLLPALALATSALCILTVLEAPVDTSSGHTAKLEAAVMKELDRPFGALRMAGISLSQLEDSDLSAIGREVAAEKNIVHVTTVLQTRVEEVPFGTRYIGVEKAGAEPFVVTAGVSGEKVVTYRLTLRDGVEASREKVGEEITRQPVDQVINRGAGGEIVIDGQRHNFSQAVTMRATAYTTENKSWKRTASGTVARVGAVAVDKSVIPLGSKLYIVAPDGSWCYGIAVAEDTGVRGNGIDLFYDTYNECIQFGVRSALVYVLTD